MKVKLIVMLAVGVSFSLYGVVEEASQPWEDRPTGSRNNIADQWWCQTWHLGDRVETSASYQFEGILKFDTRGKVRWWELWKKYLDKEFNVEIKGVGKVTTDVLLGVGPNGESLPKDTPIQLLRTYEAPMSFRGAAVIGLKDGQRYEKAIREAQNEFVDMLNDEEYQGILTSIKAGCVAATTKAIMTGAAALATVPGCQWAAFAVNPVVAGPASKFLVDKLSDFASKRLEEQRIANIKKLSSGELDDDGIEAKKKGWFFKKFKSKDADKISNFATSINSLFNGSTFYICGMPGEQIFAKKVIDGEPAKKLLIDTPNLLEIPFFMRQLPITADDNRARNIIARETLDVNAKLFGLKERKIGNAWITDASILNGFLHQDLEGRFSGYVIMKYIGDEKISLTQFGADIEKKSYDVRHLQMINSYRGTYTKFSYEEPEGFYLHYDPRNDTSGGDTALDIYVDIKSGYILKVEANFRRGEIKALPKLKLSDGFEYAKGHVTFNICAESCPMRNVVFEEQK